MTLQIFVAKQDGDCTICHKNVKGSRALFNLKKQLVHADCQFPNKASPKPKSSPMLPQFETLSKRVSSESNIAAKLNFAILTVKAQIPNAEEYQDYLSMITEVLHQLGSEEWLELEKRKMVR